MSQQTFSHHYHRDNGNFVPTRGQNGTRSKTHVHQMPIKVSVSNSDRYGTLFETNVNIIHW